MECNVGGVERGARIIIGIVAIGLAGAGVLPTGPATIAGYVVGAIGLVTGILAWCPVTSLLGIDTCKKD